MPNSYHWTLWQMMTDSVIVKLDDIDKCFTQMYNELAQFIPMLSAIAQSLSEPQPTSLSFCPNCSDNVPWHPINKTLVSIPTSQLHYYILDKIHHPHQSNHCDAPLHAIAHNFQPPIDNSIFPALTVIQITLHLKLLPGSTWPS